MAKAAVASTPAAKPKVVTVSTRQLAGELAVKHELSNKASLAILDEAISLITKHLKKGSACASTGLASWFPQARRAHGPQPGDGRSHQDQGKQEGCLPRREGIERVDLTVDLDESGIGRLRKQPPDFFFVFCLNLAPAPLRALRAIMTFERRPDGS